MGKLQGGGGKGMGGTKNNRWGGTEGDTGYTQLRRSRGCTMCKAGKGGFTTINRRCVVDTTENRNSVASETGRGDG